MTTVDAVSCPLCRERDTTRLFDVERERTYSVVRCGGCGLARTEPQPTDDDLRRSYTRDYAAARGRKFAFLIDRGRRASARRLAGLIARRAPRGTALDVGCGDGELTVGLRERGFTCVATELNPRVARDHLARAGVDVRVGHLEDLELAPAAFQVVVLRHVLEHLRDPVASLREVRRVLHPQGLLVVEVPNFASWQARSSGHHWFHLDVPRHLFHFTDATLTALLERTGFRVERIEHFSLEHGPYGWLQSIFNRLGAPWADLYDSLRATNVPRAPLPIAVVAAAVALVPACVALAVAEALARRGGAVQMWARPATTS